MMREKTSLEKLDDLKIKTYLENANEKFLLPSNDNEINVLLISSNTSTMLDFVRYYTNVVTGIFSKDQNIDSNDFKNIDYIIFTNLSECNLDNNFTFNYWDLNNYVCFVFSLKQNDN